jgi:hypothetical protein
MMSACRAAIRSHPLAHPGDEQRRPEPAEPAFLHRYQRRPAEALIPRPALLVPAGREDPRYLLDRGLQPLRPRPEPFPGNRGLVELPLLVPELLDRRQ